MSERFEIGVVHLKVAACDTPRMNVEVYQCGALQVKAFDEHLIRTGANAN